MVSLGFLSSPAEIQQNLRENFKRARLSRNESQQQAAEKTGVPLSTLKKFEQKGVISLSQFLQLCHVYGDLSVFDRIMPEKDAVTMDELLSNKKKPRKRARS